MARFYTPLMWWLIRPSRNALSAQALYNSSMNNQSQLSRQVQNAKMQMYFNQIQRDLEPLVVGERFGLAKTMLNFYLSRKVSSGYRQFTSSLLMEVRGNSWRNHQAVLQNTEKTRLRDKPLKKAYEMEDRYMRQIKAESEGRGKALSLAKYSEALVRQALYFQKQIKKTYAESYSPDDAARITEKYKKKVAEIFSEARNDGYSNMQVCEHLWRRMEKMQEQNPDLGHLFAMQTGSRLVEIDKHLYVVKKDEKGNEQFYYPSENDISLYMPQPRDVLRNKCAENILDRAQKAWNTHNPQKMRECVSYFDSLKKALDSHKEFYSTYRIWSDKNSREERQKAKVNEAHLLPYADLRIFGEKGDTDLLNKEFVKQARPLVKELVKQRCLEEAAIQREDVKIDRLDLYADSRIAQLITWDDLMKMVRESEKDSLKIWRQATRSIPDTPFPGVKNQRETSRDRQMEG